MNMMWSEMPGDAAALAAAVERETARLLAERNAVNAELERLDAEAHALGYHPNYPAYLAGGMLEAAGMGAGHMLAVAGFHRLGWRDALARLGSAAGNGDLLDALRRACEADAAFEIAGLAWLDGQSLLKRGNLDPYWTGKPKLGLGKPAALHGLEPCHHDAHRGLYTLPLDSLTRGMTAAAHGREPATFGELLVPVIEAGAGLLATRGARAIFRDAKARYDADCDAFAAHQRRTDDRSWRWKPPTSRQGYLAATTARALGQPMPRERTRGHAAGWLDEAGANIRYRED